MGKKTKQPSIVALATKISVCDTVFNEGLKTEYDIQMGELLLSINNEMLEDNFSSFFTKSIREVRVVDALNKGERRWIKIVGDLCRHLKASGKVSAADYIVKCALRGLSRGRSRELEQMGLRNSDIDSVEAAIQLAIVSDWFRITEAINCWSASGKHCYAVSADLAQLLAQTSLSTYPVKDVKSPFPSLEFILPVGIQNWLGSWVVDPEAKHRSFIVVNDAVSNTLEISEVSVGAAVAGCSFRLVLDLGAKTSVADAIHSSTKELTAFDPKSKEAKNVRMYLNFIVALLVYITLPDADNILSKDSPEYAKWIKDLKAKKKNSKREKKMVKASQDSCRHILGNSIKILDRHDYSADDDDDAVTKMAGAPRKRPVTHWRQGHMKSVRCGPRNGPQTLEPRWIKPTIVAPPAPGVLPAPKKTVVR